MVWFSYHGGHSGEFCRHAKDTLEAVVGRAVEAGFTHYGLSEHAPRFRAQDMLSDETDLSPADLVDIFQRYAAEAVRVRALFADRIDVFVGFETERLPPDDWARRMRKIRNQGPFEYVIGSVHDVDGWVVDYSAEQTLALADAMGGAEAMQVRYFAALADLVETLKPEVVGHIDLIRKFEPAGFSFGARAFREIERVLEAARASDSALDVNCGAWRRGLGPVYPLPAILDRARAMGLRVTLGDDSHGTKSVGIGLEACLRAIAEAGFQTVSYLERRDGGVQWRDAPLASVAP
ncbi:MAG TPA: histidinol-phosphatase [Rhizomicrobium sp.]|jgi:histidinol-phosphatase (PHP family)|nr:histidinol-phosphatase [Rhizomicrobium sp.]